MKLLITGASGFAGNILLDLLTRNHLEAQISVLLLPDDPGEARIRSKGIRHLRIIYGDIADAGAVDRAISCLTRLTRPV